MSGRPNEVVSVVDESVEDEFGDDGVEEFGSYQSSGFAGEVMLVTAWRSSTISGGGRRDRHVECVVVLGASDEQSPGWFCTP